jgi:hypothetical protein
MKINPESGAASTTRGCLHESEITVGKVVAIKRVTLDGVMQAPGGPNSRDLRQRHTRPFADAAQADRPVRPSDPPNRALQGAPPVLRRNVSYAHADKKPRCSGSLGRAQ